jgi:hypothetical protein
MRIVGDIEADGLLDTITRVHCAVFKDIDSKMIYKFIDYSQLPDKASRELYRNCYDLKSINKLFKDIKVFICHNSIGFDNNVLEKFFEINKKSFETIDTFVWSKTLHPDRPMPEGCPAVIRIPGTNEFKRIGPHGLEAWGWRVGERKIEYHDWSVLTPEMLHRCEIDVEINEKVYYELLKEAGLA